MSAPAPRTSLRRSYLAIGAFAAVYLIVGLLVRNAYYQQIMTLVLLWAAMGLSWNMLSGYSGLISFGHAAFFGLGGYTMTIAFVKFGISPWLGIPLGMAVGVLAGIVIGLTTFRLRGHYFALSMLAYPLAMLFVFEWLGYQEVTLPMMREAPALYVQFSDQRVYMALALALVVGCMVVSLHVERSRFGMSLLAIKQNEPAAEAAGIDTLRWKMRAIMLSAAMAAAAGGLYAVVLLVVTPQTMFGVATSAQALIVALFGGVGVYWGPVIGAAILVPLAETLHAELGHIIPGIQGVVYGLAIIGIILWASDGIYWRIHDRLAARLRKEPGEPALPRPPIPAPTVQPAAAADPRAGSGRALLKLDGVVRAFGGLKAVDGVSLTVAEGSIHGIIGPNGAGKTTLFNVINGFLPPDAGGIRFDGAEISGLRPHGVCRRGIGRTFQVARAFPRMTVLENVMVGAYAGAATDDGAMHLALAALDRVELARDATSLAGGLTNNQLRRMELARALAPNPRLLLLDETLAGLGHEELEELLRIIRQVNADGVTVVIIEHTMHAMVKLADTFSVLDHGKLVAEGPPSQVVRDPAVIEAYLGKKWVAHAQHDAQHPVA
jgi:ABC-type branched-subunit amino acid transport system ATPase component/ABC-type branched-subunit amino acid transport system permease subunit